MTNYIIEGNINFFEELMNDEEIDENNVCLLSNLPLDATHVELPCTHKFNYLYIFNEVKSSKKTNYLNIGYNNNYLIHNNELMCPYCRKRFELLLPPCKNIQGAKLLKNVNHSNKSLMIKCKDEDSTCNSQVYVTDYGYYCKQHYQIHKKSTKDQITKNKHTKENYNCHKNINNITDSSMDSSMNIVNTTFDLSTNKINIHMDLINGSIIDVSELEYKIDKQYTINMLKEILKQHKLKVSGKKSELIKRIIDKELYKLQLQL